MGGIETNVAVNVTKSYPGYDDKSRHLEWASPDGTWRLVADNIASIQEGPYAGLAGIFSGKLSIYRDGSTDPSLSYQYNQAGVMAAGWTQDSSLVALGFGGVGGPYTDQVVVFDPRTGEEIYKFDGHFNGIFALAFSPNGKMLASVSGDGTVIIWNCP
jgi:WD40 repeat protein